MILRPNIVINILIILAIAVIVGLTFANYQYTSQYPGGNDFLSRWMGTRLFLLKGESPYSETTTQAIQEMMYGRPARPDEDQVLFVYPLFSIYIFAPFSLVGNYSLARALWMTTLEIAIIALAVISVVLSRWRMPRWIMILLFIFVVSWYYGIRPVINGNVAVLVALTIGGIFLALRSNHDFLAGLLMAITMVKPQMVVLLIPYIIIWAISHQRWTVVWGYIGSLGILIASCMLLIKDWIIQNLRQVLSYPSYTLPGTPGAIFTEWLPGIGKQMGWALTIFLLVVLIWEWLKSRNKDFNWFYWTGVLTLVVTNLVGIRTATENYIAMLPALVLVFSLFDERWRIIGRIIVLLSIFALLGGTWLIFIKTLQPGDQPIQSPIMFFILPSYLLIGLYWVRWWAINPPRLLFEEFREKYKEIIE